MKGHFLTHGVINFIKKIAKRDLKNEKAYCYMHSCIVQCNPICLDKEFVLGQIKRITTLK
jgi:hypothetical protein